MKVTGPSRDIRIEMLARPKSVQWEERERVKRQQEEEVTVPETRVLYCCRQFCVQAMRQLQSANVHRNVVKPSKSSSLSSRAFCRGLLFPPRQIDNTLAAGYASADVVPIEERLFHEADNRDAIRERARRLVAVWRVIDSIVLFC